MSTVLVGEDVAELCRRIHQVITDTAADLAQAFADRHHLRGYFAMKDYKVRGCLEGIARGVRNDASELRECGSHQEAAMVLRRLALVCPEA